MDEIRIYKFTSDNKKIRTAKLKNPKNIGFFAWCRLYSTLKKYSIKN